jgi:predicted urease superfamily metal-dependent hydrolase
MEKLYYYCPKCDENRPLNDAATECPKCGGTCLAVVNSPEAMIAEEDLAMLAEKVIETTEKVVEVKVLIHPPAVYSHRYSVFMTLGFGPAESEALANSREDTHRVKKMLRGGCDVDTAVAILL